MKFPTIEIVDRYAIAVVKHRNTHSKNQEELNFYLDQMQEIGLDVNHSLVQELIEHHAFVWSLEDDFKKARIDTIPLEEIGKRALIIRDAGYRRVYLKNALADLLNDPVYEIKDYY